MASVYFKLVFIKILFCYSGCEFMVGENILSAKEEKEEKEKGEDDILATIRDLSQAVANLSQAVPKLIEKVLDNYIPLLLIDEVERLLNRKLSVSERSRVVELVNSGLGLDDIVAQFRNSEKTAQYA